MFRRSRADWLHLGVVPKFPRYSLLLPILAVLLCVLSFAAAAEPMHLYKSVHADGTVSYSDAPPPSAGSVTTMKIPKTDAALLNEGERRTKEMEAIGKDLEKQRAEQAAARRKHENRLAEARREVAEAEWNLNITRQSKHNATPERIGLAEQRVRLARQRLREVEGARP